MRFILKIDKVNKDYYLIKFNRDYITHYSYDNMFYTNSQYFHRSNIGGHIRSRPEVEANLCRRMERFV